MTHDQVLLDRVGAVRMRIRLLITQQWVCLGLTYGALTCLLLVAATKFQWWTDAEDYIWAVLAAGALTGLLIGWTRHISPLVAAQIADERGELKERLSTAVELSAAAERSEVAEAQIADAARNVENLRVSRILPWRVPKQLRYLAGAVAVLLAVIFLPELSIFHSTQERMDREAMRLQGEKIQQVAKHLEKELARKGGEKNDEILRRVAQNMKQLGKDQKLGRISKKQAMLAMNELQKQLKDTENRASGGKSQKSLDRSVAEMMQASRRQSAQGNSENARALQQMAQSLSKRDLENAKRQLEELARKMQSGKMTPDDAAKASEMLQQMAQAMEGSNLDKASQQMKDAAKQLQKAAQAAKQMQKQMQQAKSPGDRQKLQQQMAQALSQGLQQAGQRTQKAGGT